MTGTVKTATRALLLCTLAPMLACDPNDTGTGAVTFTTWGEDYIEQGIGPQSGETVGFVDGWSVKYEKFLVSFAGITVKDAAGGVAGAQAGALLVDNTQKGVKTLLTFADLDARAYTEVSYAVVPVTPDTVVVGASAADRDLMAQGGYAMWVVGKATKGAGEKRFSWGFATTTLLTECKAEQDGRETSGVVVTTNQATNIELTTHGDHLFYDRLQASPDPAIATSLRFDAIAAADRDGDGDVTLEELKAVPLDVPTYNPSPFAVTNLGDFVTALSRTVGHYRGEGECVVHAK